MPLWSTRPKSSSKHPIMVLDCSASLNAFFKDICLIKPRLGNPLWTCFHQSLNQSSLAFLPQT